MSIQLQQGEAATIWRVKFTAIFLVSHKLLVDFRVNRLCDKWKKRNIYMHCVTLVNFLLILTYFLLFTNHLLGSRNDWNLLYNTPMSHSHVEIVSYIDDDTSEQNNRTCRSCCKLRCSAFPRTMDVFSMFKHSIIADDANPITKYFEIQQHVASCGPEMVWKIYDAVRYEDKKVSTSILSLSCQYI